MELLDGVSLRQAINHEGQLSSRRTGLVALQVLRALGCQSAQGFYFSRPMNRDEAESFVMSYVPERTALSAYRPN